jgi:hypothetical protein
MMFGRNKAETDEARREALAARTEAQQELKEAKQRWPEVRSEGRWHRWRRDENHFAAGLEALMKGN